MQWSLQSAFSTSLSESHVVRQTRLDRREIWIPEGCGQNCAGTVVVNFGFPSIATSRRAFGFRAFASLWVASHSEELRKNSHQRAGSSFCEVICYPVGIHFKFATNLSRSYKITINQRTRALWSMSQWVYVDQFPPLKTRNRLANCDVFTNLAGKRLGRFGATPWWFPGVPNRRSFPLPLPSWSDTL